MLASYASHTSDSQELHEAGDAEMVEEDRGHHEESGGAVIGYEEQACIDADMGISSEEDWKTLVCHGAKTEIDEHTVPRASEIRARILTVLSGMNPPGLMILRHAPEQCYHFGVSGSALRSFSWGIPSKASYCGDTENEAIDEAINWVASVVLEGEDGM